MNEEKKEELEAAMASPEAPKQEAAKVEAPKQEAAKEAAPKTPAPKAEAKKAEEKKKEKPANCAVCNKSIKKKRYYYRDGKYYCTKRCWKTTVKKENKAAKELPPEPEAKK